ncbi:hypothetical protein BDY21DRAFT_329772 [Lineolata rhizophorae]|uniref:Uncharacterized protein n=1 Tax=Lineolata rhizophorae TaxID=578093 RepID=A0A6A6PD06_9PEZI|nr:hypothetical protein BDY21DRAFT_329772 [Lineolata rhizophorae]
MGDALFSGDFHGWASLGVRALRALLSPFVLGIHSIANAFSAPIGWLVQAWTDAVDCMYVCVGEGVLPGWICMLSGG